MRTWTEYLTVFLSTWRESFEMLPEDAKTPLRESFATTFSYLSPCQVQVVTFTEFPQVLWIVTRDESRKDMEFTIQPEEDLTTFLKKQRKDNSAWFRRFGEELLRLASYIDSDSYPGVWSPSDRFDFFYIITHGNFLHKDPVSHAQASLRASADDILRRNAREHIGKSTAEIKSEAEKVLDPRQRTKLLAAAAEISASLDKINRIEEHDREIKAMKDEIDGVRKLIGSSKEYQDWKVLVEEVAEFKKGHSVTKELFDSEIRRLDQRVDSVKEIRVGSRRMVLEIALAVIAAASTMLAALLGAGIIHF